MPAFRFRLEAPKEVHDAIEAALDEHPKGVPGRTKRHSVNGRIFADDIDTARNVIIKREVQRALATVDPDEDGEIPLAGAVTNAIRKPYELVQLEEV